MFSLDDATIGACRRRSARGAFRNIMLGRCVRVIITCMFERECVVACGRATRFTTRDACETTGVGAVFARTVCAVAYMVGGA